MDEEVLSGYWTHKVHSGSCCTQVDITPTLSGSKLHVQKQIMHIQTTGMGHVLNLWEVNLSTLVCSILLREAGC
jgi:hypothetical protein